MMLAELTMGLLLGSIGLALAIALPLRIIDSEEDWLYLAQGGQDPILRAPLVRRICAEIALARAPAAVFLVVALLLSWRLTAPGQPSVRAVVMFVFTVGLQALALADYRTRLLPDTLTLPLLWFGLLLQIPAETRTIGLEAGVLGAALGYGAPWLVAQVHALASKRHVVGMGDLKLLAMLGAWLGPVVTFSILFVAALASVAVRLLIIAVGKASFQDEYPFGPWICLAAIGWVSLSWHPGLS